MADLLEEQFKKTLQKIGAINAPKSLIKDGKYVEEFTANGTKYIMQEADKVFNINRQVAFNNLEIAFALNQTPTSIRLRFKKIYNTVIRLSGRDNWEKNMETLIRDSINNLDSFKGELTSRYPAAYYLCTLFITRENEDLSTWDFELADKKIDDWVAENIRAVDFFGLALAVSQECKKILKEY